MVAEAAERSVHGGVAEWLGRGLQNPAPRFDSARRLYPSALAYPTFGRMAMRYGRVTTPGGYNDDGSGA